MRIALLTTDNREDSRQYNREVPFFGTAVAALLEGFAAVPAVEVHVISCTQQPVAAPTKLAGNIFFHSLLVRKAGWLRSGYLGCIRAVGGKLREIQPDIVHGQGTERDCALSAVWSGFPNVLTVHGNVRAIARVFDSPPFSAFWCQARLEGPTLRRAGGVICLTEYARRQVANDARKTWVVQNAAERAFFDCTESRVDPPLLLCPASWDLRKNQTALIRALRPLAGSHRFVLQLAGQGRNGDPFVGQLEQYGRDLPWCQLGGFAGRAELRALLQSASALVLPSLEENCPMSILEAMAAGVPVAAAAAGGIPELLDDGQTGWLFDPCSEASIRDTLAALLDQPEEARRRAANARQLAVARNHPSVVALSHLAIYRELLAR